MSRYRISVDIGGTFTDFVFYDSVKKTYKEGKILTTRENLSEAIINGLDMKISDYSEIVFFVHGTTVGLNASRREQEKSRSHHYSVGSSVRGDYAWHRSQTYLGE